MEYTCYICKQDFSTAISFHHETISGNKYYCCRSCNTSRCRKYRNTKKGKESTGRASAKSIKKLHYKHDARLLVQYAVKTGILQKPNMCSICFMEGKIEAHHDDYSKPLEVRWLCIGCHSDYHKTVDKVLTGL